MRSWGLSAAEQDEVWARWRQGESLRLIARKLGKRGPSVRAFVLQTGGVQRHPPCRRLRCLSMTEREAIRRGVAAGEPCPGPRGHSQSTMQHPASPPSPRMPAISSCTLLKLTLASGR